MLNHFVFVYLDNIQIFSRTLEEHTEQVWLVLRWHLDNKLYVKPEKSEFHVTEVSFLGFMIAQGKLQLDPAKIWAVEEWPTPPTWKQLQRFLGFTNRRFICDYSRVASPLTQLTSPASPFTWSPGANLAFIRLKALFTHTPVLQHPDQTHPFIVEVDASDSGVGASSLSRALLWMNFTPAPSLTDVSPLRRGIMMWERTSGCGLGTAGVASLAWMHSGSFPHLNRP